MSNDHATPNDKYARIIGIPAVGVLTSFISHSVANDISQPIYIHMLISTLITLLVWESNRALVIMFRRRFPSVRETVKRILLQFGTSALMTSVMLTIICFSVCYFIFGQQPPPGIVLANLLIGLGITMVVSIIYETVYFFKRWEHSIVEAEEIKRQNLMFQFESLKSQVNPHFLFNSLNALTGLIEEQPVHAVDFVTRLSKVYRYVLHSREKETISLAEETGFIRAYIFLLQSRFGENLVVEIDIPESLNSHHLPPLALQLLVENAIKHNIVSEEKPLHLRIAVNDIEHLIVENPLQKKTRVEPVSGFGLQNIISRYALLGRSDVTVANTGTSFRVSLPLLRPESVIA